MWLIAKLYKLALNSIRHVASVAGHELNQVIDYVNGNYQNWANEYGANGLEYANARSEISAYSWEMNMGSNYANYNELKTNHLKLLIIGKF